MKSGAVRERRSAPGKAPARAHVASRAKRLIGLVLAVAVVSCAGSGEGTTTRDPGTTRTPVTPGPSLASTNWRVIEVGGVAMMGDTTGPTLVFDSAGQVSGNTGCNQYSGTVSLSGMSIAFSPMTATLVACPDTSQMAQERRFLEEIEHARSYELNGNGELRLLDSNGTTLIRLTRIHP
jgi:heat shock protein HslJ